MSGVDPFADIRCPDCGWVHFNELECPDEMPMGVLMEIEFAWQVSRRLTEKRRERAMSNGRNEV